MDKYKELGKIIDGKLVFLNIMFELDCNTGNICTSVDYDKRVLDKDKQSKLQKEIAKLTKKLGEYAVRE